MDVRRESTATKLNGKGFLSALCLDGKAIYTKARRSGFHFCLLIYFSDTCLYIYSLNENKRKKERKKNTKYNKKTSRTTNTDFHQRILQSRDVLFTHSDYESEVHSTTVHPNPAPIQHLSPPTHAFDQQHTRSHGCVCSRLLTRVARTLLSYCFT